MIARQPIFDAQQKVVAYELLFRSGSADRFEAGDGDSATLNVIEGSLLLIGLDKLTGHKQAFINFPQNLLKKEVIGGLPSSLVVVEILETVEPDPAVIDACRELKKLGYTLALDDFVFSPRFAPLIDLADIIKIDFLATTDRERRAVLEKAGGRGVRFLAEKVETREDFLEARELGYSLFQGFFFRRPEIVQSNDILSHKLHYIELLGELINPDLDFDKLEGVIKRDVAFSFKLLNFINSAAFGFTSRIQSIKQALVMLGRQELMRWVTVLTLREVGGDKPSEVTTVSVVRGKMGELLAPRIGLRKRASDIFLTGAFSLLDTVVGRPLDEVLAGLPISPDICDALLRQEGPLADVHRLVVACETGDWAEVLRLGELLGVDEAAMADCYAQAVAWGDAASAGYGG